MCYHHCGQTFEGRHQCSPRGITYASIMEILIVKGYKKYQAKKAAKSAIRAARAAAGLSDTDSMLSSSTNSTTSRDSRISTPYRLSDEVLLEKSMAPPAYGNVARV